MKTSPLAAIYSVKTKFLAAFMIACLMSAVVGGIGLAKLETMRANGHRAAAEIIVPLTEAQAVQDAYAQLLSATNTSSTSGMSATQFKAATDGFTKGLKVTIPGKLAELNAGQLPNADAVKAAKDASAAWDVYGNVMSQMVGSVTNVNGAVKVPANLDIAALISNAAKFSTSMTHLVTILTDEARRVDASSLTTYQDARKVVAIAVAAALIMGLVFAFVMAARLVSPIRKTVKVLDNVANGDLTQRLDVHRRDELGQMATALNSMVGTMHDVICQIETEATALSEYDAATASSSLSEMADNLSLMISVFTVEDESAPAPMPVAV
jgi:methyl-accepting chemotaxis protein